MFLDQLPAIMELPDRPFNRAKKTPLTGVPNMSHGRPCSITARGKEAYRQN